MSEHPDQLLAFYRKYRFADELSFYQARRDLNERAAGQAITLSGVLLGLTTTVGLLTTADIGSRWLWSMLATVLPATSTALAAYGNLFAFDQQSKLYRDAARAARAAARSVPDAGPAGARSPKEGATEVISRVEAVFRQAGVRAARLTASHAEIPEDPTVPLGPQLTP